MNSCPILNQPLVGVGVGNKGIASLEKTSPGKVGAGTEQLVPVLADKLLVLFLLIPRLWIVPRKYFCPAPFNEQGLVLP